MPGTIIGVIRMGKSARTTIAAIALVALSLGCTPDGNEDGSDTSGDEPTSAATEAVTADDSSGSSSCTEPDTQVAWAVDGTLVAPMTLGDAAELGIQVARSGTDEMGTLSVSVTTTCDGPLYLWALVFDDTGGNEPDNADSLYLSVDGSEESTWLYGCDTAAMDFSWWWLPVQAWTMTECAHDPLWYELPAGAHSIVVRNREGGVGGPDVAAIAGIVVSHDPDIDPSQFFPLEG